jgi:hypothetical protein
MRTNLLLYIMSLLFISCSKRSDFISSPYDSNLPQIEIDGGHLIFPSAKEYSKLFFLNENTRNTILKKLEALPAFTSYTERMKNDWINDNARVLNGCGVPEDVLYENAVFFSTLDQNGVVGIDGFLYKYDYCSDKIYVISTSDAAKATNYNDFINGRTTNSLIGSFPSFIDVIEAVAQGYRTMPEENSVRGIDIFEKVFLEASLLEDFRFNEIGVSDGAGSVRMDGKLAYFTAGLYFHFYAKEKLQRKGVVAWYTSNDGPRNWFVNYEYKYLRKGRSSENTEHGYLNAPKTGENKVDKTFYEGNRGLKKYYAQWDVDIYSDYAKVSRNGGSRWIDIFEYRLNQAGRLKNYLPGIPGTTQDQFHYLVKNGY